MDPNANLEEQRRLMETIRNDMERGNRPDADDVDRFLTLAEELDVWLANGNAMPASWTAKRDKEPKKGEHWEGTSWVIQNPDWPSGHGPHMVLCWGCKKCERPEDK